VIEPVPKLRGCCTRVLHPKTIATCIPLFCFISWRSFTMLLVVRIKTVSFRGNLVWEPRWRGQLPHVYNNITGQWPVLLKCTNPEQQAKFQNSWRGTTPHTAAHRRTPPHTAAHRLPLPNSIECQVPCWGRWQRNYGNSCAQSVSDPALSVPVTSTLTIETHCLYRESV